MWLIWLTKLIFDIITLQQKSCYFDGTVTLIYDDVNGFPERNLQTTYYGTFHVHWCNNMTIQFITSSGAASSIIEGGANIHIFVFTHHKNNRFQKLIMQNTKIWIFAPPPNPNYRAGGATEFTRYCIGWLNFSNTTDRNYYYYKQNRWNFQLL